MGENTTSRIRTRIDDMEYWQMRERTQPSAVCMMIMMMMMMTYASVVGKGMMFLFLVDFVCCYCEGPSQGLLISKKEKKMFNPR